MCAPRSLCQRECHCGSGGGLPPFPPDRPSFVAAEGAPQRRPTLSARPCPPVAGRPPFDGKGDTEIVQAVKRGRVHFDRNAWNGISQDAKMLVQKLLQVSPRQWTDHLTQRLRCPRVGRRAGRLQQRVRRVAVCCVCIPLAQLNPEERITPAEALKDKWLTLTAPQVRVLASACCSPAVPFASDCVRARGQPDAVLGGVCVCTTHLVWVDGGERAFCGTERATRGSTVRHALFQRTRCDHATWATLPV